MNAGKKKYLQMEFLSLLPFTNRLALVSYANRKENKGASMCASGCVQVCTGGHFSLLWLEVMLAICRFSVISNHTVLNLRL